MRNVAASGALGTEIVVTASNDKTVKFVMQVKTEEIAALDTGWSTDGQSLYVGALDNEIHKRTNRHPHNTEIPTSLALSPNGCGLELAASHGAGLSNPSSDGRCDGLVRSVVAKGKTTISLNTVQRFGIPQLKCHPATATDYHAKA
ncbi:hypothetical protein M378DRAFT_204587 [Amanita muscaria Koide BX008]|uniref:Uncharacterized protein n=1 Tax=Amanita muscaria (strain Koide BX008) TaxID=946122 RepID=A0A0C2TV42_AMAMK|nr:hypothetical protein M378DRAFT_204587 [Amanita muscaria Koide BX008]